MKQPPRSLMQRRTFSTALATMLAAASMPAFAQSRPAFIRAPRLKPGDTLALINPSGALFEREPYAIAAETLRALGFKVREAPNLRARYGHLAGTDRQRADDVNAMFADPGVQGLLAMSGGAGGNRMLPLVDYELIQRTPKFLGGHADLTGLINAVYTRTGLVTFHAPMGNSEWNAFNVDHFKRAVVEAEPMTLASPRGEGDVLVPREGHITTIRGGTARGLLIGGNLSVLASMAGSPYWPRFDGSILLLEEHDELIHRVDRALATLKLAGAFSRLSGVVIGAFVNCTPGKGHASLTLDELFDDYFRALNIPVYRGAQFGQVARQFTLPIGLPVEMDAGAGTLRFLGPAVT